MRSIAGQVVNIKWQITAHRKFTTTYSHSMDFEKFYDIIGADKEVTP